MTGVCAAPVSAGNVLAALPRCVKWDAAKVHARLAEKPEILGGTSSNGVVSSGFLDDLTRPDDSQLQPLHSSSPYSMP